MQRWPLTTACSRKWLETAQDVASPDILVDERLIHGKLDTCLN